MGSEPRGPSFTPWYDSDPPPPQPGRAPLAATGDPARSPAGQPTTPPRPPANPWPTLLTVIAVLVVGAVVAVSSVLGERETVRPTATRVVAPVTPSISPARADRMEFVSNDGDGVLIVTKRLWSTTGLRPPTSGTYLHIEVELICTAGEVGYGPENFSAFDATGELFEITGNGRWGTPLGYGRLWAGESVRGTIAFDLPRGEVTLLMSDSASRSVTALKIPD